MARAELRLNTLEMEPNHVRKTVVPHIESLMRRGDRPSTKPIKIRVTTGPALWRVSSSSTLKSSHFPSSPKSLYKPQSPRLRIKPLNSTPSLRISWDKFRLVSPRKIGNEQSVLLPKLLLGGLLSTH